MTGAKKLFGSIKRSLSSRSSSSSSRRSTRARPVVESPPSSPPQVEEEGQEGNIEHRLLTDTDLDLVGEYETHTYTLLQHRLFAPTRAFDTELLHKIGMDAEFAQVFKALGWTDFASVDEPGSRLLTLQFLCTLRTVDEGISFRFFRESYRLTWKELSTLLGFNTRCNTDLDGALPQFSKHAFWERITGLPSCVRPRTNHIHHPTLRFMHMWIAITLFPRSDIRIVREDELKILFAAVDKIKIAPVKAMIRQWIENLGTIGPIECTSLVTRIAMRVGALHDANVEYLATPRSLINKDYLIQGHSLKNGPNDSLIYYFVGYTNEFRLPNPDLRLYTLKNLTIELQEAERSHRSVSSRRGVHRSEQPSTSEMPTPQPTAHGGPGYSHPGLSPGGYPAPPPHMAGGSAWQTPGYGPGLFSPQQQWEEHSTDSGSAQGYNFEQEMNNLSSQMGRLQTTAEDTEYALNQHILQTHQWQERTDTQLTALTNMTEQQRADLLAYFRHMGFIPPNP